MHKPPEWVFTVVMIWSLIGAVVTVLSLNFLIDFSGEIKRFHKKLVLLALVLLFGGPIVFLLGGVVIVLYNLVEYVIIPLCDLYHKNWQDKIRDWFTS